MASRDYYLSGTPDMRAIRDAYLAYVTKVFTLAGYSDPAARAARVLALETKLATAHESYEDSQDAHKADNPWTLADFAAKAPGLDWKAFWSAAGLPSQSRFIVWQPSAVTGAAALATSEPLAAWQDWLVFHEINKVAAVLPSGFQEASFGFFGTTMSGTKSQRPRDKRAIAATNTALGDAVGKLYVQRHFPASSKADIQAMVAGILKAFDTRVAGLDWMAPATKAEARRKIETMQVGIGYPERWADYAPLEIRADDPVGNIRRAELANTRRQLAKIGQPVDRREWWMTPQTVNAVNLPLQNALNFPAAILEAPFYDPKRDAAANYGAIGAVIGHEISHSFDNLGADFDATGRLRNWWTPADLKRFEASGAALARQYDAYEPLRGVHVKGTQTLGENIADVAGLTAALEAYHASLGGKPAPVIDGMTGDQRLFLSFAQTWRAKFRDATLKARIEIDGHAPAKYRAETVRNLDPWYYAFGIKPGDKLYLPPEARVHVW
jgi:putative endopeptidase